MSREFMINVAFSTIMAILGILAIWIVKWSTDKMTQAAVQTQPTRVVLDPESLLPILRRSTSSTLVGAGGADHHPLEMVTINHGTSVTPAEHSTSGTDPRVGESQTEDTAKPVGAPASENDATPVEGRVDDLPMSQDGAEPGDSVGEEI